MKKLSNLIDTHLDIRIRGITDDSRRVKKDYLFVATKGYNVDHYDYIDEAINNGCGFIICDREINNNFPHLVVDNINEYYFKLCKKYNDVDSDEFNIIGVTGTDGKTTTATIIQTIIGKEKCAYIGTNGLEIGSYEEVTNNTTPCIEELYHDLGVIKKKKYHTISMEVSSEALLYNRVDGFKYDIIGFTNITGDHLNVHKTFDNYVACKMKLLNYVKEDGYVVVNGDDRILNKIKHNNLFKIGFNKNNDFVIKDVIYGDDNTFIKIKYKDEYIEINSPLKGKFNVYNVVMGYVIGYLYGIDKSLILSRIKELSPVKGRCELLDFGQDYKIVLDYAHTINGIKSILDAFNDYDRIVVTGCAGGREHEKRSIIGKMIINNSDVAIFTMDDPRYEDVDLIIDEMVGNQKDYFRIIDREDAINYALNIAYPGSVVLILGKGRDNYMAIKDKKIHYSDYDVICNYFKEK